MVRCNLHLAPIPKRLTVRDGVFVAQNDRYVKLEADVPQVLLTAAKKTGLGWQATASPNVPKEKIGLIIRLDEDADIPAEGYKLSIKPNIMEIVASTPAGAFYGACTLAQIIRQTTSVSAKGQTPDQKRVSEGCRYEIPCLSITDWPDYPERGVMLDISRDKVPTMETLYHLIDLLAEWKINQFQLYTEHTFAYLAHPKVWAKASPITGEEIMALDEYCQSRYIELVPNQNSFGHFERWLKFDEYRDLAECPDGFEWPWGGHMGPTTLNPTDKRSVRFLAGLYDELLPHFTSSLFNVGCDETWELGKGRSAKVAKRKGVGRVYLDFLLEIYRLVTERGRTMQFWGDIILHHPELIPELPKDVIALEWGYEYDHPFAERVIKFAESGVPFYVAPGTSSWNSLAGRTENAIENISSAAKTGIQHGAIGLLNTDWGDNGHWQPLSVSYLGYMAGAMASWNAQADIKDDLANCLSLHAFGDCSLKAGRAFYDIGNIYRVFKKETRNCTIPWQVLFRPMEDKWVVEGVEMAEFDEMEARLKDIAYTFIGENMTCQDAAIIREEFDQLVRLLQLAAEVGKYRLGGHKPRRLTDRVAEIKMEHEVVWLLRNRPGGLADSESKFCIGDD
jgi:hypothetical protein